MKFKFKEERTFEQRKKENEIVFKDYPTKITIICEKAPNAKLIEIPKTKYLVDKTVKSSQFYATIKNHLKIDEKEAIFLLINGKITLSQNETMGEIYKKYKDKDGFLYIAYASQEIWG